MHFRSILFALACAWAVLAWTASATVIFSPMLPTWLSQSLLFIAAVVGFILIWDFFEMTWCQLQKPVRRYRIATEDAAENHGVAGRMDTAS